MSSPFAVITRQIPLWRDDQDGTTFYYETNGQRVTLTGAVLPTGGAVGAPLLAAASNTRVWSAGVRIDPSTDEVTVPAAIYVKQPDSSVILTLYTEVDSAEVVADGTATDVHLTLRTRGAGAVRLDQGKPDYVTVTGGTGGATVAVTGSSTDANLVINPKGAGVVVLGANLGTYLIASGGGSGTAYLTASGQPTNNLQLVGLDGNVFIGSGAADYLSASGGVGVAQVLATGTSTDVDLNLGAKGAGGVRLDTLKTDYAEVTGGTGTATIAAVGASTNVDLVLAPKGSGKVTAGGVSMRDGMVTSTLFVTFDGSTASSPVSTGHATLGSSPTAVLGHANFAANRRYENLPLGSITTGFGTDGCPGAPLSTRRWHNSNGDGKTFEYHVEVSVTRGTGHTPVFHIAHINSADTAAVNYRYTAGANADYTGATAAMHGKLLPGESIAVYVSGTSVHALSFNAVFRAIDFS